MTPTDPNYIKYVKEVTTDLFKEENLQKTKDFLALFLISYNFYLLQWQTVDSTFYTVEEYNQILKEMLKTFSLKVTSISNFQLHDSKGGYDIFSFSCTSKMKFVMKKDGETKKVSISTTIHNESCHFEEIAFLITQNQSTLKHQGQFCLILSSEAEKFITTDIEIDKEEPIHDNTNELYCIGIYPSLSWLDLTKELILCQNCH